MLNISVVVIHGLTPNLLMFIADLNDDQTFTISIHYGGHFDEHMDMYIGGTVKYYDWCSIDYMSFLDMIGIAKTLKLQFSGLVLV